MTTLMVGVDDEYTDGPKEHIHSEPKSFLMTMEKYVSKKNFAL